MTTVAAAAVPLAVHVRVTRAAADLVEHAGIAGLAVWPEPDEIVIQVPKQAGDVPVRAAAVARLAALAGTQPAPTTAPARPAAGSPPAACSPGISCASSPKSRSHHDRPAIPAANDAAAAYQRLRSHLAYLKLPAAAEAPGILDAARVQHQHPSWTRSNGCWAPKSPPPNGASSPPGCAWPPCRRRGPWTITISPPSSAPTKSSSASWPAVMICDRRGLKARS